MNTDYRCYKFFLASFCFKTTNLTGHKCGMSKQKFMTYSGILTGHPLAVISRPANYCALRTLHSIN